MGRRWPGKTRGAIGFALNFFVTFFFQVNSSCKLPTTKSSKYNILIFNELKICYLREKS